MKGNISFKSFAAPNLLLLSVATSATPADEIAIQESRLSAGHASRDAKQLNSLRADPFTWVHSSEGGIDDRKAWPESAARGMALSGQRNARREFDATVVTCGVPARTAVRV